MKNFYAREDEEHLLTWSDSRQRFNRRRDRDAFLCVRSIKVFFWKPRSADLNFLFGFSESLIASREVSMMSTVSSLRRGTKVSRKLTLNNLTTWRSSFAVFRLLRCFFSFIIKNDITGSAACFMHELSVKRNGIQHFFAWDGKNWTLSVQKVVKRLLEKSCCVLRSTASKILFREVALRVLFRDNFCGKHSQWLHGDGLQMMPLQFL